MKRAAVIVCMFVVAGCSSVSFYGRSSVPWKDVRTKVLVLPVVVASAYSGPDVPDRRDFAMNVDNFLVASLSSDPRFVVCDGSDVAYRSMHAGLEQTVSSRFHVVSPQLLEHLRTRYGSTVALLPVVSFKPDEFTFHAQKTKSENNNSVQYSSSLEWQKGAVVGVRYILVDLGSWNVLKNSTAYVHSKNHGRLRDFVAVHESLMDQLMED